jgi:hypothetical protein
VPTRSLIKISPHRKAIWLSPQSWLIHCSIEQEHKLVTHLNATSMSGPLTSMTLRDQYNKGCHRRQMYSENPTARLFPSNFPTSNHATAPIRGRLEESPVVWMFGTLFTGVTTTLALQQCAGIFYRA